MGYDAIGALTVHILLRVPCSVKEALYQYLTSTDTISSITQPYRAWNPGTGKASGGDGYEGTARKADGFGMLMPPLPPAGRRGVVVQGGSLG